MARICRSLVCRVGQAPNILSLEAAAGTPSGQAVRWGLALSLLFLIKALKSRHLSAHRLYEPFCLALCASLLAPCAGWSEGKRCSVFPLCRQARHPAVWQGRFLWTMKGREDISFYTVLSYLCAAGRGGGVTGKSCGSLTTHSHFSFLPFEEDPDFHSFSFKKKKE